MKKKEFYDLAAEMEKACGDWENSEGLSGKAMESLISRVEAMAAEEEAKHSPKPVKMKHFRMKKRYILILAAGLTIALGMGVVGDRAWIVESNDLKRNSEVTTKVDNEDKKDIFREEEEVYQEISDKLGIVPMRLGYFPDGMVLDSYTIIEDTGWVYLNYLYDDKIISIQMIKKSEESSSSVQWDGGGKERKLENVSNEYGYQIDAYCIDEENQNYRARISYGNAYYDIFGAFSEEQEFIKILERIYFKNM